MARTVSQPRPAAIASVLAKASSWTAGRRKSDNKPFFFVPGSKDAVYMTATDGCTCPAAQNSVTGDCKHQAAVRQYVGTTVTPAAPRHDDPDPGVYPVRNAHLCRSCGRGHFCETASCAGCPKCSPAPKPRASYADLFPKCRTCDDIAENRDGLCYSCGSAEAFRLDRESRAAVFATIPPFTLNPTAE